MLQTIFCGQKSNAKQKRKELTPFLYKTKVVACPPALPENCRGFLTYCIRRGSGPDEEGNTYSGYATICPDTTRMRKRKWPSIVIICILCLAVNIEGSAIAGYFKLPIYLDSAGTIAASAICGMPGIFVALATNLAKCIMDASSVYYAVVNVLVAMAAAYMSGHGHFHKVSGLVKSAVLFAAIGGGTGYAITWVFYDNPGNFPGTGYGTLFISGLCSAFLWDLADKGISVVAVALALHFLHIGGRNGQEEPTIRRHSIMAKLALISFAAMAMTASVMAATSSVIFSRTTISEKASVAGSAGQLMAGCFSAGDVERFLTEGEKAEGYTEAENALATLKESFPDVLYMYVYQVREDGCHVVFDIDTEREPGAAPGEIIPFDQSFSPYINDLLDGEELEPVISDDTYGYLLTSYTPVYGKDGKCVCYCGVDISMARLRDFTQLYIFKLVCVFLGFSLCIVAATGYYAKARLASPILSIAGAVRTFAMEPGTRDKALEKMQTLEIRTGDEVEELHRSVEKMALDSVAYVAEIQEKQQALSQMQDALVTVLADAVESRDECTGMHVKKTAAYVRLILEKMRAKGMYPDVLTDEYISQVAFSAPLHDVGKIKVPDAVLNKPGKLDENEFAAMKSHAEEGGKIISQAAQHVPDASFLDEAWNLAECHHEKWDGTGYPAGLKGDEIPLSARAMAVADVFDALVSKRSYKAPFTYEKAFSIIEEGAGTHFDPDIVEVFLDAKEEVIKIAGEAHCPPEFL